ncbi:flagellar filament capping protein FliD [Piscinibacter sp. HJYY11]|uniref:flagellar filament capping protein FliD n=1 Tax=Piscinibacter sp. HJYY11 TaxID=2801333 RepID=UPI00191D77A5|nr:flagellar filament capping protein FliD [Piscinibacter sp. HJYY11]MBL0727677.1 flagellar filament capping protein FliD [Piscinibacter sp. HJYY11]
MASVSSAGIGSGLDVESIVTKLMSIEERPVTQLKTQASTIQTKISAFGQLQSALSTFRDAANSLTRANTWGATTAVSSDAGVRVGTSDGAPVGNYAIEVRSLAAAQSAATAGYESADALVGAGTLRVEIGSFGQAGFAPQPNLDAINIDISATDTLTTVRNKINAAGAGVSAIIVNDATGARIIISSTNPGSNSVFRTSGDGGAAAFAFEPGLDPSLNAMSQTQAAADAQLRINGLDVISPTNTLTDVVQGLTINLLQPTTGTAQVTVSQDNDALKKSVDTFVESYNALAKMLRTQTKYDESTKTAGSLQGDSTAVGLQRQLRNLLTSETPASSVYPTINALGMTLQTDGSLKVDATRLTAALNTNPAEVRRLFSAYTPRVNENDPDVNGIAKRLSLFADKVLGVDGSLTSKTEGLNTSLKLNQKRQDELTDRLALTEARLRAQYTSLDTNMAKMSALNSYITNQVAAWNKSS